MTPEIIRARIPKTATANNAAATVTTEQPKQGQSVYIIGVYYSYTTALTTAKTATITDGTTTLVQTQVLASAQMEPAVAFQITPGLAAVISLPASGAGGNLGNVNVVYWIG